MFRNGVEGEMIRNKEKGLTVEILEVDEGGQNRLPQNMPLGHKDYLIDGN